MKYATFGDYMTVPAYIILSQKVSSSWGSHKYNVWILMLYFIIPKQNPNAPGMHNTVPVHDRHVRVSYQDKPGFLQRIQGSFWATLFGIVLVLSAFPVLYWNEVSNN